MFIRHTIHRIEVPNIKKRNNQTLRLAVSKPSKRMKDALLKTTWFREKNVYLVQRKIYILVQKDKLLA